MKTVDAIKLCALGAIVSLLAVIALNGHTSCGKAYAGDAASSGNIIALTSRCGTGNGKYSALYLIDTSSKNIAVYIHDNLNFGLSCARTYSFDVGIGDMKFKGGKGATVKQAKKAYDDWMNKNTK